MHARASLVRPWQVDSFETKLSATFAPGREIPAIFIRAPVITRTGKAVKVLSQLDVKSVGLVADTPTLPVAIQQGSLLGIAFHPELTADDSWHAHFMSMLPTASPAKKQKKK